MSHGEPHQTRTCKSLRLHSGPAAGAPPSFRFAVKGSRSLANASFTNSLLPTTVENGVRVANLIFPFFPYKPSRSIIAQD